MKNIVLIGFMGCGKTSVGRFYAKKHRMKQIDTDHYIENEQHCRISDIFSNQGEAAFRQMETDALRKLIEQYPSDVILSVGGGLPMKEENHELLHRFGTVIYLKASVDTLEERLRQDRSRPLLQGGNLREKIEDLMALRATTYETLANYTIETDYKNLSDLEAEIMLAMDGEMDY